MSTAEKLRLNQAVARTGLCSRRKADELIAAGRVAVNGRKVTDFSFAVDIEKDELQIDGKSFSLKQFTYVMLNKPPGIVTTMSDEQGRQTVMDLLPKELRHLRPVGRLDMYSEGLLLLTNDGQLTQALTHPVHHMPKLYAIRIKGKISDEHLRALREGIELDDGITQPAVVKLLGRTQQFSDVNITISEGRNRQLRRMFAHLGYPVQRLVRLAIGRLQLGQIASGTWRYLSSTEVSLLTSNAK